MRSAGEVGLDRLAAAKGLRLCKCWEFQPTTGCEVCIGIAALLQRREAEVRADERERCAKVAEAVDYMINATIRYHDASILDRARKEAR